MTRLALAAALLLAVRPAYAVDKDKEAPSWVSEVAGRELPPYSGKVPAVVLLNERKVTVATSGIVDTVTRHAVKILTYQGKRQAEVVEGYEKHGRQVRDLHAWLVAPAGFIKAFDKGDVEDLGAYSYELYNDFRLRRIKAENAEIGSVFAYECEVVGKAAMAEDRFAFQVGLPEIESRYSITLPAGWTVSGTILNHEPVSPVIDGNTYTWTIRNLPFRQSEEAAPHLSGTAPTLAVDFQPPTALADLPTFKSWADVSHWHEGIAASQAQVTPEIAIKVRELTAGLTAEYDKIRALGRYVQNIRYVEIAMDLSRGGGYRPHPAAEVFEKQYGDCKDKANLLRAMLQSAGIPSYLVAIYSGDRTFVKKDWASPSQFNHMILAIQVSDATKAATVIDTPLGHLLMFDPTDYLTPMGDLPYYEQGSYALICAGARGDLFKMPVIGSEANSLAQTVQATLDASGKLTASMVQQSHGQAARNERIKHASVDRYKAEMERYLGVYAKGAAVHNIEARDAFEQNNFSTSVDFESVAYGQLMQNRLLVFNPGVVEPEARHFPAEPMRHEPIVLNGRVYRKQVTLKLPDGFTVDDLPKSFRDEAPFGTFSINFRQEPGEIFVEEELRTEAVTLPSTDYPRVKKFFDNVFGADNQSAVLIRN